MSLVPFRCWISSLSPSLSSPTHGNYASSFSIIFSTGVSVAPIWTILHRQGLKGCALCRTQSIPFLYMLLPDAISLPSLRCLFFYPWSINTGDELDALRFLVFNSSQFQLVRTQNCKKAGSASHLDYALSFCDFWASIWTWAASIRIVLPESLGTVRHETPSV